MKITALFISIFLLCTASMVYAAHYVSTFRCGPKIVALGDTKPEVRNRCGEPTSIEVAASDERGYL